MPGPRLRPLVLLAVALTVLAAAVTGCSHRGGQASAEDPSASPATQSTPSAPDAPGRGSADGSEEDFARPDDTEAAVRAAGLVLLGSEQLAVHYHALLEVEVDGRSVDVPASIGIGTEGISELHTHDTSGTIHIESAEDVPFTLGQFMTEWDVALTPTCLGDHCVDADHALTVTVDGRRARGNPAEIVLERGMEIQITYGPKR